MGSELREIIAQNKLTEWVGKITARRTGVRTKSWTTDRTGG